MRPISVVIITFNEAKNLSRCLASVQHIADEIIVLDSFSTDETVDIARAFGAAVHQHPFQDFVAQKRRADLLAAHDWILSLDADEALTPQLEKSIRTVKAQTQPAHAAYRVKRLTNYCGAWIRHCGWYPDKKTRFYNRTKGNWAGAAIHERWKPTEAQTVVGELDGDLLHYSFYTYSDHVRKIEKYTEMAARIAVQNGKKVSLLKWLLMPPMRFLIDFIFRAGFRDGWSGYMVCKFSAWSAFVKYSKIRQYSRSPFKE
jgi:glycosyltransferase involved in cell wall biosynthesis